MKLYDLYITFVSVIINNLNQKSKYCYVFSKFLRLQTVTKLVTLLVFIKSLCACQFSK